MLYVKGVVIVPEVNYTPKDVQDKILPQLISVILTPIPVPVYIKEKCKDEVVKLINQRIIKKINISSQLDNLSYDQKKAITWYASTIKQQIVQLKRKEKDLVDLLGLGSLREYIVSCVPNWLKEYFNFDVLNLNVTLSEKTCDEWIKLLDEFKLLGKD